MTQRIKYIGMILSVSCLLLMGDLLVAQPIEQADTQQHVEKLSRSIHLVKNTYVDEMSDEEILEGAIDGMLQSLDPHSRYLDEEDFNNMQLSISGEFAGLGMHVIEEKDWIKVISPIDDTPAFNAGIKAGNYIVKINQFSVIGMNLDEAVAMMRGKPGTSVELTLVRSSGSEPIELEVVRDNIKIKSVKSELIEKNIGYIRISQFQGQTAKELISSIDNLKEQSKNDLKGIALDLRNNPRGLLDAAVAVSDTFLDYNQSPAKKDCVYKIT